MKKGILLVFATMLLFSCQKELFPEFSTFIDARDGNTYEVVTLGTQTWLAENLKYLPEVHDENKSWEEHSSTSPRYYVENYHGTNVEEAKDHPHYDIYGVLYNFPAAEVACPEGWRLPGEEDWEELKDHVGRSNKEALLSEDLWVSSLKGTNESGFNLRPSPNKEDVAVWSTGRPSDVPDRRYVWGIHGGYSGSKFTHSDVDDYGLAYVRCIKVE